MSDLINKISIGLKIKQIREDKNLRQSEFADIFKVSQQTISQIEKGIIAPSLELLVKITSNYCLSIDEIVMNSTLGRNITKNTENNNKKTLQKTLQNTLQNEVKDCQSLEIENAYLRGKVDILKEMVESLQQKLNTKEKANKTA